MSKQISAREQLLILTRKALGIKDEAVPPLTHEELAAAMKLSHRHHIENLAAEALLDSGISLDEDDRKKLLSIKLRAVMLDENRTFVLKKVSEALTRCGIDHIPLKGSVIKALYPRPDMRSSVDIDVLVRESEIEKAMAAVESLGEMRFDGRGSHDVGFVSSSGVRLELHYSLLGDRERFDNIFSDVWENSHESEAQKHLRAMSDEDLYLYILTHAAKHFVSGGCGVRTVLDVHFLRKNKSFDEEYIASRARKNGIYTFMRALEGLAALWFGGDGTPDGCDTPDREMLLRFEEYILDGSVFGSEENRIALERSESSGGGKNQSRVAYLLKRFFLPLRIMKLHYPVLKKAPILLPLYWIVRLFRSLGHDRGDRIFGSIRINQNLSDEKMQSIYELYSSLGFIQK